MKREKELIMSDEIEVFKETKKIIRSNKCRMLCPGQQQDQIFKRFKLTDNFINMVNKFEISQSTMIFKIAIVKFLNRYPRSKNSSLSIHFVKQNFKIITHIFHEDAREFKKYFLSKYF